MWLTDTDTAAQLRLAAADEYVTTATDAARAWVERQRPDLDYSAGVTADIHLGAVLMACLLYNQAGAPGGIPSFQELATYEDAGPSLANIYRLIGSRRPVVC